MLERFSYKNLFELCRISRLILLLFVLFNKCIQVSSYSFSKHEYQIQDYQRLTSNDELLDSSNKEVDNEGWSQWWSYDGISGPDYWSFNKEWALCSTGKLQSPVNIETDGLVYDHTLTPLKFDLLPTARDKTKAQVVAENEGHTTLPIKLTNAGRGIEVWFEFEAANASSNFNANARSQPHDKQRRQQQQHAHRSQPTNYGDETTIDDNNNNFVSSKFNIGNDNEKLNIIYDEQREILLSNGPLVYSYKLYKIELHSALLSSVSAVKQQQQQQQQQTNDLANQQATTTATTSEHTISSKALDAELQFYFYNTQLASNARDAHQMAAKQIGANLFAAISLLIKVTGGQNSSNKLDYGAEPEANSNNLQTLLLENKSLKQQQFPTLLDLIVESLDKLESRHSVAYANISQLSISTLLESARNEYITYKGSLNKPPCAETVDWIVSNKPLIVDTNLWSKLTSSAANQDNVRPTKPSNKRQLRFRFDSGINQQQQSGKQQKQKQQTRNWNFVSNQKCEFSMRAHV